MNQPATIKTWIRQRSLNPPLISLAMPNVTEIAPARVMHNNAFDVPGH
jgi:hypothetical protein